MAAPQGYWLGNKFIFTPAPPPVWPEAETLAEAVSAPPYVAQRPRSIFGGDSGDPGVTGNTPHGWAQNVTESELPGWDAITGMFSDPFDSSNTREFGGEIYNPSGQFAPRGEGRSGGLGMTPGVTVKDIGPPTDPGRTPAERAVAPGTQTGESRTTPEYKAAETSLPDRIGQVLTGILTGNITGKKLTGPLEGVSKTVAMPGFMKAASVIEQLMGMPQTLTPEMEAARQGEYVTGYNPNVATNDWTGPFGLGYYGNTEFPVTPMMFDSMGIGKGGPYGYGYGFKQGGGFGALTATDVGDIDGMAYQAGLGGVGTEAAAAATAAAEAGDAAAAWGDFSPSGGGDDDPGDGSWTWDGSWDFHHGGMVEGPDPETEGEEFQANMLEGEYVIRPEVVELLGPEFFDRLNKLFEK